MVVKIFLINKLPIKSKFKKLIVLVLLSLFQFKIESRDLKSLLEDSKEVDKFCTYPSYQEVLVDLSNKDLDSIDGISKITINGIKIGNIKKLAINLSGNKLEEIPTEIALLKNLTYLNLSNNLLDSLPPAISNLKNLKYLNLFGNKLKELPNSITKLKKLEHLNLFHNRLESLPEPIDKLKNLKYLNLANNFLTLIPLNIAKLSKLDYLNLSNNELNLTYDEFFQISDYSEENKFKQNIFDFIDR